MYYHSSTYLLLILCFAFCGVLALSPPPSSQHSSDVRQWPFANDGVVNPPEYYQRYRRDEFPADSPFFQWWYYYFSDFENNRYFFMAYGVDETHNETDEEYFYFTFGEVDAGAGSKWQKAERFNLSCMTVTNYFDIVATDPLTGEQMYHLEVLNNNTFHLYGVMNHTDNVYLARGIAADTVIAFDVTLSRLNGWYPQQDIEKLIIEFARGEIAWNPYTHNSLVEGKIMVGSQVFAYEHSPQYRGYGDMNWGERFPAGPSVGEGIEFPWGWFTANVPNEDPTQDFALVVGTGKALYGFPLGKIRGTFADFIFNNTHLGIRQILGWDGDEFTLPVVTSSSDGELLGYSLVTGDFVDYIEGDYNFSVPLTQSMAFETTHYNIVLNYTTTISKINRLMFTYGEYIFSDFEALGSTVHILVDYTDDDGKTTNLFDFTSQTGGFEFGYETFH